MNEEKAYICLANGKIFEGTRFGAGGDITGELVFTTGMGGYIETLTDPSYYGQIVMQTFPLIGNYGFIDEDCESAKSFVSAYIVHEKCDCPSNFRCNSTLEEYMKKNSIIGVYGVDTREITKIIRESGVMNATICSNPKDFSIEKTQEYKIEGAVEAVSVKRPYPVACENPKHNVVLIDYGKKENIVRELTKRNCNVAVMPSSTKAEDILKLNPDGIMLSNGPGDPDDNKECIEELKKLVGKKPIFGICLGHQLLALAMGAKTEKLKYGHRGVNQPVKNLETGRTYISSQNHGYAVINETVEEIGGEISYINANDGTNEGINYPDKKAFSVQFHPEACSGPHDTRFLFDKFINMMGGNE
ncbi:MAG: carbamoyl phosphate synthase small subunit [Eubacterium sp.]